MLIDTTASTIVFIIWLLIIIFAFVSAIIASPNLSGFLIALILFITITPIAFLSTYDVNCTFLGECNTFGWIKAGLFILYVIILVIIILVILLISQNSKSSIQSISTNDNSSIYTPSTNNNTINISNPLVNTSNVNTSNVNTNQTTSPWLITPPTYTDTTYYSTNYTDSSYRTGNNSGRYPTGNNSGRYPTGNNSGRYPTGNNSSNNSGNNSNNNSGNNSNNNSGNNSNNNSDNNSDRYKTGDNSGNNSSNSSNSFYHNYNYPICNSCIVGPTGIRANIVLLGDNKLIADLNSAQSRESYWDVGKGIKDNNLSLYDGSNAIIKLLNYRKDVGIKSTNPSLELEWMTNGYNNINKPSIGSNIQQFTNYIAPLPYNTLYQNYATF